MREVHISARASDGADEIFARICDFERYPELTDAVRAVTITASVEQSLLSEWEVSFRNGILRWSEEDEIDRERRTVRFRQLDGDFDQFTGNWSVEQDGAGCTIRFQAQFDLGMPTLADMLDPIAEGALRENITRILEGLVGPTLRIMPAAVEPVSDTVAGR
jgi:ribosome-associated toxin RatA of RatAB toxin-antitoxin module